MSWPPTLVELKDELSSTPGTPGVPVGDTRDDTKLQRYLDAAVSFVERVRPQFNYTADPVFVTDADTELQVEVPEPTPDIVLGTLRLAIRWNTRRRSPDGLVAMAEQATARIPSFDPDIDRLLGIGRYRKAVFA